ncbi:MAG: hypothetical protein ACM30G_07690 [Micromonosporaceae bacterium]
MLNLHDTPRELLGPVAHVVRAALDTAEGLRPDHIMIVGAWCRDILHCALGHTFPTAATRDLDLALALSSWDAYRALAASFTRVGNTGIRFRITGTDVDLLPFGDIEDPQGVAQPPPRGGTLSVWAFEEIFASSLPLALTGTLSIQIPTAAGYAAAKLGAWLDRSEWHKAKDAADLALIMHWYTESPVVHDRLYDTPIGNEILMAESTDLPLAATHLLGTDVITTIGSQRRAELLARWPGNANLLKRELGVHSGPDWSRDLKRRSELIDALTRGLSS